MKLFHAAILAVFTDALVGRADADCMDDETFKFKGTFICDYIRNAGPRAPELCEVVGADYCPVACDLCDVVDYVSEYFTVTTQPINDSTITTETTLFVPQWEGAPCDVVCFTGCGEGLEPDLMSTYGGGGEDCTSTNGCGVHIHSGFGCDDSDAQGGHWYDSEMVMEDPWKQVGYKLTGPDGTAEFADCVQVGFDVKADPSLLEGRAFVVHKNDGSRASCGLMTAIA